MNKPLCDYADSTEAQLNELELPTEIAEIDEAEKLQLRILEFLTNAQ